MQAVDRPFPKLSAAEQLDTLRMVLASGVVRGHELAIDGGANHGDWAVVMAGAFECVIAFEPAAENLPVLYDAVAGFPNVEVEPFALFSASGRADVVHDAKRLSHRSGFIAPGEAGSTATVALDSLNLDACDLLKLDIEGAEHDALLGAAETIRRFRPVLILEIDGHGRRFGHSIEETEALLESFGYVPDLRRGPDVIYILKEFA